MISNHLASERGTRSGKSGTRGLMGMWLRRRAAHDSHEYSAQRVCVYGANAFNSGVRNQDHDSALSREFCVDCEFACLH